MRAAAAGRWMGICGVVVDCKTNAPPFDDLRYYFSNLSNVNSMSLLMIAVGGIVGFWWGRDRSPWAGRMGLQPVKV